MSDVPMSDPEIRVPLLDGWHVKESYTLIDPSGDANVIVSSEPLGGQDLDSRHYAALQGSYLHEEFTGYEEIEFAPHPVFGGRPGFLRTFRWTPEDGEPVVQLQSYFAEGDRGYTATATVLADTYEQHEATLRFALESIQLTPASN
jgi:hypothetical protein